MKNKLKSSCPYENSYKSSKNFKNQTRPKWDKISTNTFIQNQKKPKKKRGKKEKVTSKPLSFFSFAFFLILFYF